MKIPISNQCPEARRLIYEKSNTYRIHADNLRWYLLFGYAAFITGVLAALPEIFRNTYFQPFLPYLFALLFIISNLYLLILAVQNWYYVLYSKYVNECETNLLTGQRLRTAHEFAKATGSQITGFHPAFFFALFIVILISSAFFIMTIEPWVVKSSLLPWAKVLLYFIVFIVLLVIYLGLFSRWDKLIYKQFISRLEKVYK